MENKNENRIPKIALIAVFCAVLFTLFVLMLALPKHAGEISPLEFRALASHPIKGKTAEKLETNIITGQFTKDVDKFLEDHFPGRSFLIALDSYYTRLTGRNADKSVVWGKNGRLFDAPLETDYEQADKNAAMIDRFAEANGLDSVFVVVPSSSVLCESELPLLHLDYHDAELQAHIAGASGARVPDLIGLYSAAGDCSPYFYRTDHHWTMDGAYLCYSELCGMLGEEPVSKDAFSVEGYDFRGSYYRKAGLWLTEPDVLEIWRAPQLEAAEVTIGAGESAVKHTGVYDGEKLEPGEVDRYAAYLYSNNGITVIKNPEGNGRSLMIVKDSYGNSIAPLLAMNYSNIVMIDTRYYRDFFPMPSEFVREYGIDKLLVVMGGDSVTANSMLVYLR